MDTVSVLVGVVRRPHGLHGEVSVEVRTDEPERRFTAGTRFDTDHGTLTVTGSRWHQGRLLVTVDGVEDRSTAERLRNLRLWLDVPGSERPADPAEFYDHQLVGLSAYADGDDGDDGEAALGAVVEVLHLPGQDVLVIRDDTDADTDEGELMVPFVAALVPEVDLAAGTVVVRPPAEQES